MGAGRTTAIPGGRLSGSTAKRNAEQLARWFGQGEPGGDTRHVVVIGERNTAAIRFEEALATRLEYGRPSAGSPMEGPIHYLFTYVPCESGADLSDVSTSGSVRGWHSRDRQPVTDPAGEGQIASSTSGASGHPPAQQAEAVLAMAWLTVVNFVGRLPERLPQLLWASTAEFPGVSVQRMSSEVVAPDLVARFIERIDRWDVPILLLGDEAQQAPLITTALEAGADEVLSESELALDVVVHRRVSSALRHGLATHYQDALAEWLATTTPEPRLVTKPIPGASYALPATESTEPVAHPPSREREMPERRRVADRRTGDRRAAPAEATEAADLPRSHDTAEDLPEIPVPAVVAAPAVVSPGRQLESHEIEVARARARAAAARLPTLAERAQAVSLSNPVLEILAPDLRHTESRRFDARRVAEAFDLSLRLLARALGSTHQALSKTPDSPRIQSALIPFVEVYTLLSPLLTREDFLAWLHTPRVDLAERPDGAARTTENGAPDQEAARRRTPLATLLAGDGHRVSQLLTPLRTGGVGA
jgi:hypothetical protein